jgi:hypothetical protein
MEINKDLNINDNINKNSIINNNKETNTNTNTLNISFEENDYSNNFNKETSNKILYLELMNFIEVFIHSVLYLRKIYPQEIFQNYQMYDLGTKFITEKDIIIYINQFLEKIEILLNENILQKIKINIFDPDKNFIIEYFTLEIFTNEYYDNLCYEDLYLSLKSILYKFYFEFSNKKVNFPENNKSFFFSIETKLSKIYTSNDFKFFDKINKNLNENFLLDLFNKDSIRLIKNSEEIIKFDNINFSLSINRNSLID